MSRKIQQINEIVTEIKKEKVEIEDMPVIIQTIQSNTFPITIKQEHEENFELAIPDDNDDDYGEIEVLDEFIEEVKKMSPIKIKAEIKSEAVIKEEPEEPSISNKRLQIMFEKGQKIVPPSKIKNEELKIKEEPEDDLVTEIQPKKMNLRGVRINLSKILGTKVNKPKPNPNIKHDTSLIEVPNCFNASERPFKCKKCPLSFKLRRDLTTHRAIHKKADFWCRKCGQKFRFQASYLSHDCDFWCNICGKSISNKANLKIHLSYVHGIGQAKLFTCDLCGTTYKSKRNIDTHMKNHMESTPFTCAICSKGFSHAGALKIHMWNHRDLVNCEICKKKFKPRSLYYHIKRCRMMHDEQHVDMFIEETNVIKVENVKYKVVQPQPVYIIKIKDDDDGKMKI
ncbi:zinc finger and BTB domain-containing protein 49-like [Chironomus tepperi]|uniref:zinc finger and BTB domain-containing protein 49-like n=1 Tax=Chironomus tepperi TaxID=113505 RepID=UPI00391F3763